MLNLTLVGNLGTDATAATTKKGTPIVTLRVAVNLVRTDTTTGERTENAEWFRVHAMGRLVDLAQRLTKGARVLVIGRLDIGHYQSSEGEPRVSYDVWADTLVPLGARPSADGASGGGRGEHDQSRPAHSPTPDGRGSRPQGGVQSPPARAPRGRGDQDDENLPW
jgi:single-strand DNA-binding protein